MRHLVISLLLFAACKSPPTTTVTTTAAPVKLDPPCPPAGAITLPDGKLRCRELPFEIEFPPNTKLQRSDDGGTTLFAAQLDRGVIALVAEPRTDAPDANRISELLANLAKGIAADATTSPAEAPKLEGAVATAALAFTTPDGGAGVVQGYFANHWLFAVVVGGRLATTPTRPDSPLAKSFLGSIRVRPLPAGMVRHELDGGAHVDIPATAWSTGKLAAEDGVRAEWIMLVPDRGVGIGIRDLEPGTRCADMRGTLAGTPAEVNERLKATFGSAKNPLSHAEKATYGDVSIYAQADADPKHVAMYLICSGHSVTQLSVVGDRPIPELRKFLDEFAKTFVGAK
jgi:hypothetical protein